MSSPAVAKPIITGVYGKPQGSEAAVPSFQKSSSFPLPSATPTTTFSSSSSFSNSSSTSSSNSAFRSNFPTLPRPPPVVDSSHAAKRMCQQMSLLLSAVTAPTVIHDIDGAEQQMQASLARLDEYAALVEAVSAASTPAGSELFRSQLLCVLTVDVACVRADMCLPV